MRKIASFGLKIERGIIKTGPSRKKIPVLCYVTIGSRALARAFFGAAPYIQPLVNALLYEAQFIFVIVEVTERC